MLGTLYGDLVACSFKQNRMKLGDELVREDAFFSDKGLMALATADALMIKDRTSPQSFKTLVADYYYGRDKRRVRFPQWFEQWLKPESGYSYDSDCGMVLPMCCIAAPIDYELSVSLFRLMLSGKASMYATWYLGYLVKALKEGKSKQEALLQDEVSMLPGWINNHSHIKQDPYNALNSLITAWMAFERAHDYAETVRLAAEMSKDADTRVVTMVAATLAEVYYKPDVEMFRFPKNCTDHYGEVIKRLREIDGDAAIRQRIEVELVATHGFDHY